MADNRRTSRNAATVNHLPTSRNAATGDNRNPSRSAATGNHNAATGNRNAATANRSAATANGTLAVPQMMPPHLLPTTSPTKITPPATPKSSIPKSSTKVTSKMINAPHGYVTGYCEFHPMCGGKLVKIVNEEDPKDWHLECDKKNDRIRPCKYRLDADGTESKPLPRSPPPTPITRQPPNVAQGPTPTSTVAGKSGVPTPVSEIPPPVALDNLADNATPKPEASKQFGSTQRQLFRQPGKRPASDLGEGSHTPPAKRVCEPVRTSSATCNTASKVKEEFDEQTRKRPASDFTSGSHTQPPTKRVCSPVRTASGNSANNIKDEFDDDDIDWEAATELAKSVEAKSVGANSRSKIPPAVFNQTRIEAHLAETPSKPPRQTKPSTSHATTKPTMPPGAFQQTRTEAYSAETPSKPMRQTKPSHHNNPTSSKHPTSSKPTHTTTTMPSKQRSEQKQPRAPAQPTAQRTNYYPPAQPTCVPEYVNEMVTPTPTPTGPRIIACPGDKTPTVQGQSAMMPPPTSRRGKLAWTPPAAPPVSKGPGGTQAEPIVLD